MYLRYLVADPKHAETLAILAIVALLLQAAKSMGFPAQMEGNGLPIP
jgi:hypothetical protein